MVYGNVFAPDFTYLYGYGAFPAPNDPSAPAFSAIVKGEGGIDQGNQQLVVFSDYNNVDHASGNWIEANVYQEQTIEAGDAAETWVFEFDAKRGNLEGQATAVRVVRLPIVALSRSRKKAGKPTNIDVGTGVPW